MYRVLTSTSTHNNCPMEVMAVLNCATWSPDLGRVKAFTPGVKLCSSLPLWWSPAALLHICITQLTAPAHNTLHPDTHTQSLLRRTNMFCPMV